MDIAWGEEGVKEIVGPNAEPSIISYFIESGRHDVTSDETPWCAAFVGYCLDKAGIPSQIAPGDALLARSYLRVGTRIDQPRPGSIAVLRRGTKEWQGHVGFVVGSTSNTIALLGGNQSNSVKVSHYPRDDVIEYRWPTLPKSPTQVASEGSRTVTQAKGAGLDAVGAGGAVAVPPAASALPPMPSLPELASKTSEWRTILEQLSDFGDYLGQNIYAVGAVVGLYFAMRIVWRSRLIEHFRTDDANIGKTNA
ncbi:MAG: TIGR02594 family protein [Alphaproteobacteria bacterium]|nr:TIGR02594 family protein [Alphaproteobacteria bacterium]